MSDFPFSPIPFSIVGFDLDGTLVDSARDLGAAVNHALQLAGRPPVPQNEIPPLIGGGAKRMLERALVRDGGMSQEEFHPLYKELLRYYGANLSVHTRPFPGCEAMLDELAAAGCKLAVVTNKFEGFARRLLTDIGLIDRFEAVLGGDSLGPGKQKPQPDLLHEMVRLCGGGRAAFVGDTLADTGAAQAAGLRCVAVSFGFSDRPAKELGADAVIDDLANLPDVLRAFA